MKQYIRMRIDPRLRKLCLLTLHIFSDRDLGDFPKTIEAIVDLFIIDTLVKATNINTLLNRFVLNVKYYEHYDPLALNYNAYLRLTLL